MEGNKYLARAIKHRYYYNRSLQPIDGNPPTRNEDSCLRSLHATLSVLLDIHPIVS